MKKIVLLAASLTVLTSGAVNAAIIGGSASFEKLTTTDIGASQVLGNGFQNNTKLFGFDEQAVFSVDAALSGLTGLGVGTQVASHFVFFDPINTRNNTESVLFSQNILAVLFTKATLNATDAALGLAGINYYTGNLRGEEARDSHVVAGNQLTVDWRASSPGDGIRVITGIDRPTNVPEPAAFMAAMAVFGVCGLQFARRRSWDV